MGRLGEIGKNVRSVEVLYSIAFAAYGLAVWKITRPTTLPSGVTAGLFLAAILARIALIPIAVSDDVFRYLWEGRIQLEGFNPYAISPDDPRLERLRDENHAPINHKELPTIYPPIAQFAFAATAWISPTTRAMKALAIAFDLLSLGFLVFLLRSWRRPARWALIYGLNPLVLLAFAGEGHYDSIFVFSIVWLLWAVRRRGTIEIAAALAFGVLTKSITVLWLPFFLWRSPRTVGCAAILVVVGYLPYASAGEGLIHSLTRFSGAMQYNDSICALVHLLLGSVANSLGKGVSLDAGNFLCLAALLIFILWSSTRRLRFDQFAYRALAALLILSPTLHPWYLTWMIPFICLRPQVAWLLLTGTTIAYYEAVRIYNFTGKWEKLPWVQIIEYVPFYLTWFVESARRRRRWPWKSAISTTP
jgi:hypothetical protein